METLQKKAASLIEDKNRTAKAVAVFLRNKIEDFHVIHLSDEQMKSLNPLIRGAIFSFLVDHNNNYEQLDNEASIEKCCYYIFALTINFLRSEGLSETAIEEFYNIIEDHIDIPLRDLARGGLMLAVYELFYVPSYWEDCLYYSVNNI